MVMRVQKSGLKRNASSTGQSRGQKVQFNIKSNVLENSIDYDKYQEESGQMKVMKYLRESCYHRIKYSATNSLTLLMRK